jgi:hypothetical protein
MCSFFILVCIFHVQNNFRSGAKNATCREESSLRSMSDMLTWRCTAWTAACSTAYLTSRALSSSGLEKQYLFAGASHVMMMSGSRAVQINCTVPSAGEVRDQLNEYWW